MNSKTKKFFRRKNRQIFVIIVAILLLIPLLAMQFTDQVNWSSLDFVVMAMLLFGIGFTCEQVFWKVKKNTHRLFILVPLLIVFFLIWAELAVGIFGSPFAGS
ncbi:hypothetical protein [Aequorivita marisscotiae]|uniref:Uncharacterized protein n=1 Tax=Aequorivita marisscotiae TaxID=3040348 RepID=A0ABY8KP87_9FLAO|nr:hypothetical protein [Aequorivita sp. Ant34-E75]WGF91274.1 hypothetical protein QCQ61_08585 [Aequorivita sp. Ant34-E75]